MYYLYASILWLSLVLVNLAQWNKEATNAYHKFMEGVGKKDTAARNEKRMELHAELNMADAACPESIQSPITRMRICIKQFQRLVGCLLTFLVPQSQ